MNGISIIIWVLLAAAMILAVCSIISQKKTGGCGGSCAGCPHRCAGRRQ